MLRCLRVLVLAFAVCLLPLQGVAAVLMPLCALNTPASADLHPCNHARGAAQDGHSQPLDSHHLELGACGVCHLTAGATLNPALSLGDTPRSMRFDTLDPGRILSHFPEQPHHPPLG